MSCLLHKVRSSKGLLACPFHSGAGLPMTARCAICKEQLDQRGAGAIWTAGE